MLSVEPTRQRRGLGRQLIDAVMTRCRSACCLEVEIHVVNLRRELPALYQRLGFVETATRPFRDDGSATRPCHFIVMKRPLT
jgi:ribosomal protein S18 acetylase RimI-like enzyme